MTLILLWYFLNMYEYLCGAPPPSCINEVDGLEMKFIIYFYIFIWT